MSSTDVVRFSRPPAAITLLAAGAIAARRQELAHRKASEMAYQRGAEETKRALEAEMHAERESLAALQKTTFEAIATRQEDLIGEVRRLLPELALEIARRVLAGFEPDTETVKRIAAETLAEIEPGSRGVEIWLSPRDFEIVTGIEKEFEHRYPGIRLSYDPDLSPGDCRARSHFGDIDGRAATKLDTLARTLS